MRTARLVDWMVERDLVFHLRRVEAFAGSGTGSGTGFGADPFVDPRYDTMVARTMTDEERRCQVERLRRRTPLDD